MYYRYFQVQQGPFFQALVELLQKHKIVHSAIDVIANELGTDEYLFLGTRFAGFKFNDSPDRDEWMRVSKHPDFYAPRTKSDKGKDLTKRIKAIGDLPNHDHAVSLIGLSPDFISFDYGRSGKVHRSRVAGKSDGSIFFVVVPWRDIDPEKLVAYQASLGCGERRSDFFDHLLWTPPEHMEEIKEWQMEKVMGETD